MSVLNDMFCATTRPDEGISAIGLPGGKVDPGESIFEAGLREAKEEGWLIDASPDSGEILKSSENEKYELVWVRFQERSEPIMLTEYKEKHRNIKPVLVTKAEIAGSGHGNDFILNYE